MLRRVAIAVYLVVGLLVANSHNYFKNLGGVKQVISAAIGLALWPLVLFGVNLHIK